MNPSNVAGSQSHIQVILTLTVIAILVAGELDWLAINNSVDAAVVSRSVAMGINASDSGVDINMPGMNMSANDNGAKIDLKDNPSALTDPSKVPGFSLQMMNNMPMVYMSASGSAVPANGQQLSANGQSMTVQINIGSHPGTIQIRSLGDHFELTDTDKGSEVNSPAISTTMGLSIDNQKHSLSVKTSDGTSVVTILPNQALDFAESQQMIDVVSKASLVENATSHRPAYQFQGVRNMKLFGLIGVPVSTQVQVDTTNAQAEITSQPWYMNVFGWLFTPAS